MLLDFDCQPMSTEAFSSRWFAHQADVLKTSTTAAGPDQTGRVGRPTRTTSNLSPRAAIGTKFFRPVFALALVASLLVKPAHCHHYWVRPSPKAQAHVHQI